MKKLVLLLALAFVMCGCVRYDHVHGCIGREELYNPYYIVIIDSCEYIKVMYVDGLTHKGNCKYCAERRKKEQEELIRKIKEHDF